MFSPRDFEFVGAVPVVRDGDSYVVLSEILARKDGMLVLNMPSLMMIDYDMPSDRHFFAERATGTSLEHLREMLVKADGLFAKYGFPAGPAAWRIHRTGGGYHAFRMDEPIEPGKQIAELLDEVCCDRGYVSLVRNTKKWPIRVTRKGNEARVYEIIDPGDESKWQLECKLQLKLYEQTCVDYAG